MLFTQKNADSNVYYAAGFFCGFRTSIVLLKKSHQKTDHQKSTALIGLFFIILGPKYSEGTL